MDLHALKNEGWTNKEISEELGFHPATGLSGILCIGRDLRCLRCVVRLFGSQLDGVVKERGGHGTVVVILARRSRRWRHRGGDGPWRWWSGPRAARRR